MLAVATASSVAILAAWFPTSDLLHQRSQLASSSAQLGRLNHENAALRHREKQLRTPADLGRIAQQQYGLVPPGEQAYQVLPPSGSASSGTLGATSGGGGGGSLGASVGAHPASGAGASRTSGETGGSRGSFLGRILQTLEFWR